MKHMLNVALTTTVLALLCGCGPETKKEKAPGPRKSAASFTVPPELVRRGVYTDVRFTLSGPGDVTIAVHASNGSVVRHLTSRVVEKDSLTQKVTWDGRDDYGKPAPAGCRIAVGLGLGVKFDRTFTWKQGSYGSAACLAIDRQREQLYVAGSAVPGVLRVNGRTGRVDTLHMISRNVYGDPGAPTGVKGELQVSDIALDVDGEIYVRLYRDDGKSVVRRYDRGGISILFGNRREIELSHQSPGSGLNGLAVDRDGDVYVVNFAKHNVLDVYGSQGIVTRKAHIPRLSSEGWGPRLGPGKELYFTEAVRSRGRLVRYAGSKSQVVFEGVSVAPFDVDAFGRAAVPDTKSSRVKLIDAAGKLIGSFETAGKPYAIAISDEALYVYDEVKRRVVRGTFVFAHRVELPVPK
ncbi:hypothetical protein ACFL01_03295 [Planctomycetota bacterium]